MFKIMCFKGPSDIKIKSDGRIHCKLLGMYSKIGFNV